jgi:hypothetical protein
MSHFQKNKEFYDKPIRLSEGEKKDPFIVLDEFFTDYNLSEIREINQQADQACLTTDTPPFDDPDKRNQVIYYRESEEKVLEAASILLQNRASFLKPVLPQNTQGEAKTSPSDPIDLDDLQKRVMEIQLKVAELCKIVVGAWGEKCLRSLH